MSKSIKVQVAEKYGATIKATDSHTLMHLIRQEKPNGEPFTYAEFGGRKVVEAAQELAVKEMQSRGMQMPDFSSFFWLCNVDH